MKLEDQVAPLELARRMKELGFPKGTLFRWVMWAGPDPLVWGPDGPPFIPSHEGVSPKTMIGIWEKGIPAPTASEMGEWLLHAHCAGVGGLRFTPNDYKPAKWHASMYHEPLGKGGDGDTEVESRAALLIALADSGRISPADFSA